MAKASSRFGHTSIKESEQSFLYIYSHLANPEQQFFFEIYFTVVIIILQHKLHQIFGMRISILISQVFEQVSHNGGNKKHPLDHIESYKDLGWKRPLRSLSPTVTFSVVFFLCVISLIQGILKVSDLHKRKKSMHSLTRISLQNRKVYKNSFQTAILFLFREFSCSLQKDIKVFLVASQQCVLKELLEAKAIMQLYRQCQHEPHSCGNSYTLQLVYFGPSCLSSQRVGRE